MARPSQSFVLVHDEHTAPTRRVRRARLRRAARDTLLDLRPLGAQALAPIEITHTTRPVHRAEPERTQLELRRLRRSLRGVAVRQAVLAGLLGGASGLLVALFLVSPPWGSALAREPAASSPPVVRAAAPPLPEPRAASPVMEEDRAPEPSPEPVVERAREVDDERREERRRRRARRERAPREAAPSGPPSTPAAPDAWEQMDDPGF